MCTLYMVKSRQAVEVLIMYTLIAGIANWTNHYLQIIVITLRCYWCSEASES